MPEEKHQKDISISDILKTTPNRFMVAVALAKRSRQLQEGAKPLCEVNKNETMVPILVALQEIAEGHVKIISGTHEYEELEMLDKMDELLEKELQNIDAEEKSDKKKGAKDKDLKEKLKTKGKSLAA